MPKTHQNGESGARTDQSNGQKDPKQHVDLTPESPIPKSQKNASPLARDNLSPEFQGNSDEDELGKLMGDAGEKLLAFVDNIRKIESLRSIELDIPQLVVVGDTSTGKSSVLQALTRLPFPVAGDLCTRFVTETTIRRCRPSENPGYRIEVKMDLATHNGDPPFPPKIFDSNDWIEVYQNLKQDIADVFGLMSPDNMPPLMTSWGSAPSTNRAGNAVKRTSSPQLLRHRLQITVRKRDQAHFSIVDIPGLVSNGAREDIKLSEELAIEYIRNKEAIILAVTAADNVLENQKVFTLAQENGAIDRTIGVLTRCDRIQETNEDKIFGLLRNGIDSPYHLKLGWFAVRNRSSKEILDESTFEERDEKETELFDNGKWKEAILSSSYQSSIDSNVLGIKYLKRALQQSLYKRVKENFPLLKVKMRNLKLKYQEQLQSLGESRDNVRDQRVYLSDIQSRYESEVERSLNGDYRPKLETSHPSRLRHHVKGFNHTFGLDIQDKALKYSWQPLDEDTPAVIQTESGKGPRGGILEWIYETWDYHLGSEPRFDLPRGLKKELFKEQTHSWEARARTYIKKVDKAIRDCNTDLFETACGDDGLRAKIREKLEPLEIKAFNAAEIELQQIMEDFNYLDSWHPFLKGYIEEVQFPRMSRQVGHISQMNLAGGSADPAEQQILKYQDFYTNNKRVFEVHDWLYAYWKVTFPRFIDNVVIQIVERHLLGRKGPLRLFNRHWIDCLDDGELEHLAGEDEATMNERKKIKERLEGLDDALKQANIALR